MAKGGPGSGKRTISKRLEENGFLSISLKDILLKEGEENVESRLKIKESMDANELVPLNIVIHLLKVRLINESNNGTKFVIHGFPKNIDQVNKFEKEIIDTQVAIYLKVSDQTMKIRYKQKAELGGTSYDDAIIESKLTFFKEKQAKCVEYYAKQNKLCVVDGEVPEDVVYRAILKCIKKKLKNDDLP
ncbi:hypothetical protein HELRODRAFT_172327 [Helobdella robusta]|uniref:Adenylate kinase n=1 Tax=Helobdella robusta TaxID=6412 RepID=T1F574_HELRO|nr:hypothetical protein HELRODRAFT_172327 [Helobdella robusta]ESO04661.1 hypothetical protein HELRODRAFT_172327 [Helobdella robusta]